MNNARHCMTFGEHLDAMRKMLFRILGVVAVIGVVVFSFKDTTFYLLLAPTDSDFVTWRWLAGLDKLLGTGFEVTDFHVALINTELASQFQVHLMVSLVLALLLASPYILFELFGFIAPALYARERRYAVRLIVSISTLFLVGVALSYFVIFPVSFRFLATYQVAEQVANQIRLSSYITSFAQLTLLVGAAFELPAGVFFLARARLVSATTLRRFRRHAIVVICMVSAVITPPDAFSLVLVATPVCLLYEVSIWVAARFA